MRLFQAVLVSGCLLFANMSAAFATNGMLMEGYGPISHAMGGTAMAFDNGNGAMANNPATLGLMPVGNRIDVAVGFLLPHVKFSANKEYTSESDLFMMPAAGYVRRQGDWAYGLGVYSQGGMGADFEDELGMFSQVIVGKIIAPVSYNVTEKLTLGATVEYVRASMDMMMGPFEFKDTSNFTGAAVGEGVSGKLGAVYKLTDKIAVGGAYQHKGEIGDLTGRGARVQGFDLPASAGVGVAAKVTDSLLLTADFKKIFWSETMKTITVKQHGMKADMVQNWQDQSVVGIGAAYNITPELTIRIGASFANNPIKDNVMPLFPAIIKNHYTTGFGYQFDEHHSINASYAHAPKVTKPNGLNFMGTKSSHEQNSFQLMYSLNF